MNAPSFQVNVRELTYKAFYYLEITCKEEKAAEKAQVEIPKLELEISTLQTQIERKRRFAITREATKEVWGMTGEKAKLQKKLNRHKQAIAKLNAPQMLYERFLSNASDPVRYYNFSGIEAVNRVARGCAP